jgi:hypothetical protein
LIVPFVATQRRFPPSPQQSFCPVVKTFNCACAARIAANFAKLRRTAVIDFDQIAARAG